MIKRLTIQHVPWMCDKRHYLLEATVVGWIIFFVPFALTFAKYPAVRFEFWLFLLLLCLVAAFAWAHLTWRFYMKPHAEKLATLYPPKSRGP